ncbi:hypothetical protein EDD16DRAFT_1712553 [Pisolithus croceorrhizus]|nr:hypothetical protein EDD16DRAFT_1712553 [Pisolithus croceorrhizus]KAI6143160.1 hypothetical protein EDD17DRAFT_1768912 [Pisolithus thermaeus]
MWGFYSQGQPVLAHPLLIQGTFQHAISGHVASLPTALVHLHLDNLELGHPQVNVLDSYFQPYFSEKSYHFSHLPFNLATEQSGGHFPRHHSDEERGDLFDGHLDGKPVVFKVSECLQVLFNPLTKIVQGADIIFYVCGSVVTVKDSFNDLKEAAQKFKPKSMILFDTQHLQLASTTPYLLSLLDSTIVQGFDVFQAAKFALNDCALLGRHSNIIIMMWKSEGQGVQKTMGRAFASSMHFSHPPIETY